MAQIMSIGELIHHYRRNSGMTLAQLSESSGVSKGTISKIENEDVKRPEYTTFRPLVEALHIPLDAAVELYISFDTRADTLLQILQDVIQHSGSVELARKVGVKFLESSSYDSCSLVERLYDFTASVEPKEIRFTLYQSIVDYSRDHGIMPFLAKGLLQVYLIERDDFSQLRIVYENYKYIVKYINFLNDENKITLYYKLAIHAFNLFLYRQSIELGLEVLQRADADHVYYENALCILRDSYFRIEDYEKSEHYSSLYKQYDSPYVKANSVLMEAALNTKKGRPDISIKQLTAFLKTCSQDAALLAINQLMQLYLQRNQIDEAKQLLAYPIYPKSISTNNPNIISQLAEYYYHRAEYYVAIGDLDKGISDFLDSALYYSKVNDIDQENQCINQNKINELRQKLPREQKEQS